MNPPFESGFASALQNIGAVSNNGVELGVTLTVLDERKSPVGWTTTFNYSRNKNKVLDLGNGVTQIFANSVNSDLKLLGSLIQVGYPLGVFYGYKTDGSAARLRDRGGVHDRRQAAVGHEVESRRREAGRRQRRRRDHHRPTARSSAIRTRSSPAAG